MTFLARFFGPKSQQPALSATSPSPVPLKPSSPHASPVAVPEGERALERQLRRQERHLATLGEALLGALDIDIAQFLRVVPDFHVASGFLAQHWADIARSRSPELLPEDIDQSVQSSFRTIVTYHFSRGRSPAEAIYRLAWAYGYRPQDRRREPDFDRSVNSHGHRWN